MSLAQRHVPNVWAKDRGIYRPYAGRKGAGGSVSKQLAFRGRKDDGVESLQESDDGATWEAGLNTDYSWTMETRTRLRFVYQQTSADAALLLKLYANYDGLGYTWVDDAHPYVRSATTTWYVNGTDCTEFVGRPGTGTWNVDHNRTRLGSDTGTIRPGPVSYTPVNGDLELEFCLRLVAGGVVAGKTILFRLRLDSGVALNQYINTPALTIAANEGSIDAGEDVSRLVGAGESASRLVGAAESTSRLVDAAQSTDRLVDAGNSVGRLIDAKAEVS